MATMIGMKIDYDPNKNAENIENRRLSFDEVIQFEFETALRWEDTRRDYGEIRYCALGKIINRVHAIVYTRIDGGIRVISFRKANRREVKNMNAIPNPERADGENPEWSDEMFAQAVPMMDADPDLVALSKRARIKNEMVRLETDVAKFFPDADSVNEALRLLIRLTTTNRALLAGQM